MVCTAVSTDLVQRAGVEVDAVPVAGGPVGERLVVLERLLHVLGVVLLDVVVRPDRLLQLVVDHLPIEVEVGTAQLNQLTREKVLGSSKDIMNDAMVSRVIVSCTQGWGATELL